MKPRNLFSTDSIMNTFKPDDELLFTSGVVGLGPHWPVVWLWPVTLTCDWPLVPSTRVLLGSRLDQLRHRLLPLYTYDPAEQEEDWGEEDEEEERLEVSKPFLNICMTYMMLHSPYTLKVGRNLCNYQSHASKEHETLCFWIWSHVE